MSVNAVHAISEGSIPRFSEAQMAEIDEASLPVLEKEFFCPQGHDFVVAFNLEAYRQPLLPIWECPTCQTVALDHPPGCSIDDLN